MLTRHGKRVHDYIEGSGSDNVENLSSRLSVFYDLSIVSSK